MRYLEKTPAGVDPIAAHHMKAIKMVTDSLFPRHREDSAIVALSQILTWAAVRDGNLQTAEQSLDAIEALAENAMRAMA